MPNKLGIADFSSNKPSSSISIKETLKNDPISLSSPSESVFFDQSARFKRFLGSFWALWLAHVTLYPILGAVTPQAASKAFLAMIRLAKAKSTSCWAPFFWSPW